MDGPEREYHVARIVAGMQVCSAAGETFEVRTPTRRDSYLAGEVHREAARAAELMGLMTVAESRAFLKAEGFLEPDDEERSKGLASDIDEIKVRYFENFADPRAKSAIAAMLADARGGLEALWGRRNALYHVTAESAALSARTRFLIGASSYRMDGSRYWPDPWAGWRAPDPAIDAIMDQVARERLGEHEIRELARTDPWASIWSCASNPGRGVLDVAAADLSDEQRGLVAWSRNLDRIREHPEPPRDEVVADDDALDGWLVLQRRAREKEAAASLLDGIRSQSIRDAHEVFMVVRPDQPAEQIEKLNSAAASMIKGNRMAYLSANKRVNEMEFPDTQQRLMSEIAAKGGR